MAVVSKPDLQTLLADKVVLRRILEEQDAVLGFVPDPDATPQRARELMLADGVQAEANEFSREIIRSREEE